MAYANQYYLRIDADALEDARAYATKADAVARFALVARELDRFGQACTAMIHVSPSKRLMSDYPDYALSLGPRGGIVCKRC